MVSLKLLVVTTLLLICILELTSARRFRRRRYRRHHRGRFYRRHYDRLYNYYPDFYDPYYDDPYYDIDLQDEESSTSMNVENPEVDDGKVAVVMSFLPSMSADLDLKVSNSNVTNTIKGTDADLDLDGLVKSADMNPETMDDFNQNITATAADLNMDDQIVNAADADQRTMESNGTKKAVDLDKKIQSTQRRMKVHSKPPDSRE